MASVIALVAAVFSIVRRENVMEASPSFFSCCFLQLNAISYILKPGFVAMGVFLNEAFNGL